MTSFIHYIISGTGPEMCQDSFQHTVSSKRKVDEVKIDKYYAGVKGTSQQNPAERRVNILH